ncbi:MULTISPECIES: LysE family translocator [Campylobacter]|uniref:LysE family transporter n=1 Tax=Campylobacter vicugnae TaxID=1660076 RepID=A0ABZ2E997_9BACT|nr:MULTISPECIES: LysE family transporter [unclassified Campylobacter]MCR8689328.1 LysE family translocator [Campylobacter sp. RM9264]MCR8701050.1 LysE family translocator [Campylobacter sp. RM12176]
MQGFIEGLALGFGAAVPIGPVNVLIMSYALVKFRLGLGVGLGAMAVDMGYLFGISFGVLKFSQNELLTQILAIFGSIFLFYIAYLTFFGAKNLATQKSGLNGSFWSCFVKGALMNLVNPYIIGFWLSVSGIVALLPSAIMGLAGLFVSIASWVLFLSFIVSRSKKFIGAKAQIAFAYISAILMVGFAIMLIFNTFLKG